MVIVIIQGLNAEFQMTSFHWEQQRAFSNLQPGHLFDKIQIQILLQIQKRPDTNTEKKSYMESFHWEQQRAFSNLQPGHFFNDTNTKFHYKYKKKVKIQILR